MPLFKCFKVFIINVLITRTLKKAKRKRSKTARKKKVKRAESGLLFSRSKSISPYYQRKDFQLIAKKILSSFRKKRFKVELYLTKSSEIKALNKRYRGKNKATDVLSFPSEQHGLLGSIIIDVQTAKKQAKIYKHSVRRELQELFVHGVLHLLGFDHEMPKDAAKMKRQEEKFNKHLP